MKKNVIKYQEYFNLLLSNKKLQLNNRKLNQFFSDTKTKTKKKSLYQETFFLIQSSFYCHSKALHSL